MLSSSFLMGIIWAVDLPDKSCTILYIVFMSPLFAAFCTFASTHFYLSSLHRLLTFWSLILYSSTICLIFSASLVELNSCSFFILISILSSVAFRVCSEIHLFFFVPFCSLGCLCEDNRIYTEQMQKYKHSKSVFVWHFSSLWLYGVCACVCVLVNFDDDDSDEANNNIEGSVMWCSDVPVHSAAARPNKTLIQNSIQGKCTRWTAEQLDCLRKAFQHFKKPPDTESIRKLISQEPCLKKRSIPQIKSRAWALINSIKK